MRTRAACPEWGRQLGPLVLSPSSTGISEQGVTQCQRAWRHPEGNSFPSTPESSRPGERLWQQCLFPGTISCPGWGTLNDNSGLTAKRRHTESGGHSRLCLGRRTWKAVNANISTYGSGRGRRG